MAGNLSLTQISAGQNNKHVSSNEADEQLDLAITDFEAVSLAAGNVTLDDGGAGLLSYKRNQLFVLSGHSVARDFTLPAVRRLVYIKNDGTSAGAVSVKRGTTTLVLPIGESRAYYTDGTANGLYLMSAGVLPVYDLGINRGTGTPTASLVMLDFIFTRSVNFPAALLGSVGDASVAATAQTDFDVRKNGASVGTIRWAAAATTPTFIAASPISFAAGDKLTVVAPGTPDATLAGVVFTLAGFRTL